MPGYSSAGGGVRRLLADTIPPSSSTEGFRSVELGPDSTQNVKP